METLTATLQYCAAASRVIAGFVGSSIAWLSGAVLTGDWALGTQNIVVFGINILGVYRYLVRTTGA